MAKMFYSLEEAAQKLHKSPDEVRQMAARKEITEFRDGERLIFKVDQIDLLAGEDETSASDMSSMIPLADTGAGTAMGTGITDAAGASGTGETDTKQRSGISVFDIDATETADPSAATVSGSGFGEGLNVEALGSGSGLMDMAREPDDTSIGASELLDELYPGGGDSGPSASGSGETVAGSGLFEAAPGEAELTSDTPVLVAPIEAYDAKGSGLVGGLSLGAAIALALAVAVVLMGLIGAPPTFFATFLGGNILIMTGILLGVVLVTAGLGFFLGSKTA
ncbi:MAG TPA: hypothetical protein VG797_07690 [Phycisphaerales bacterium]|nr:hypothetical protein [Phycisphaerales bacterium]